MTIDELAVLDAAERRRIHAKAIEDVANAIAQRRAARARTDALERHLASLESARDCSRTEQDQ
jgi:hypothetical protein